MTMALDRRGLIGAGAISAGLLSVPVWARTPTRGISSDWRAVQSYLDETVSRNYVPGAGAALARGTDQADFFVAGRIRKMADAPPVTPDSLWRAYSMTKPLTGITAMMLIEDGKLSLDQNIAELLPAFANPRVLLRPDRLESRPALSPITVRTLLTHTAGLGYNIVTKGPLLQEYLRLGLTPGAVSRRPLPGFEAIAPTASSLEEFADRLATLPLIADPGVKWSYSVSLDLLGRVIEVASGMSFDGFMQKRLLDPLGMTSTYWQVPDSEKHRLTDNYAATPFGTLLIDPGADSVFLDKPAFPFGGAGLVTSMRDYDRFLAMLMGLGRLGRTQVMKRDTAIIAMSNLVHPKTQMSGYVAGQGFGAGGRVTIKEDLQGSGIGTFGWGGAASTIGWVDPARRLRASGWSQIMVANDPPFTSGFGKAVYHQA